MDAESIIFERRLARGALREAAAGFGITSKEHNVLTQSRCERRCTYYIKHHAPGRKKGWTTFWCRSASGGAYRSTPSTSGETMICRWQYPPTSIKELRSYTTAKDDASCNILKILGTNPGGGLPILPSEALVFERVLIFLFSERWYAIHKILQLGAYNLSACTHN